MLMCTPPTLPKSTKNTLACVTSGFLIQVWGGVTHQPWSLEENMSSRMQLFSLLKSPNGEAQESDETVGLPKATGLHL